MANSRRGFFQTLFGGAAVAAVAANVEKVVPVIAVNPAQAAESPLPKITYLAISSSCPYSMDFGPLPGSYVLRTPGEVGMGRVYPPAY